MADIYITEYCRLGRDAQGQMVAAGWEPNNGEQVIVNPVASTQSTVLKANTSFVMVHASAAAHLAFGENPTAATTAHRLAAGETRFYGVQERGTAAMKIAAINGA
jgi:hypothetical protein